MYFIERMEEEFEKLNRQIDKLVIFLDSDAFNKLDKVNQQLLMAQHESMETYSSILDARRLLND